MVQVSLRYAEILVINTLIEEMGKGYSNYFKQDALILLKKLLRVKGLGLISKGMLKKNIEKLEKELK